MKFDDITFPHPVLGISDSVKGKTELISDIELTEEDYIINITYILDNEELLSLVKEGKAEYFCEVNCTNTIYRKYYTSNNNLLNFTIPRKDVRGKVEFTCLLIASQNIDKYKNTMFHPDYNNYTFDLDEGDLLVFFKEETFSADIKYEKLKAVSSFMEIVEKEDITMPVIDLKKPKIEIQLPSIDFKMYSNSTISQEPKYAPVFHASMALNALLIALYSIEEHLDYLWAEVIQYRLLNDSGLMHLDIKNKENVPEIAHLLLGNPFNRLLVELSKTTEN